MDTKKGEKRDLEKQILQRYEGSLFVLHDGTSRSAALIRERKRDEGKEEESSWWPASPSDPLPPTTHIHIYRHTEHVIQ